MGFAVFSPDGTHEWCLLIIHAIKCYLCLLSPVSARKRKRDYDREGENEGQNTADDKNHCCGHMHVHLYEWTRTLSRCLNTRVSNKATGLTCSYLVQPFPANKCAALPTHSAGGNQTVAEDLKGFFFLSLFTDGLLLSLQMNSDSSSQ